MQRLNCDYFTRISTDKLKRELTKNIEPYQGQIILTYQFLGYGGERCYADGYEPPSLGPWISLEELLTRKSPPIPTGPGTTTQWNAWSALVRLGQISGKGPLIIETGHPLYDFAESFKALFVNTNDIISQYDNFHGISRLANNLPVFSKLFDREKFHHWGGIYIGLPEEMVFFNEQLNSENNPDAKMVQFPVNEMLEMLNPIKMVQSAVGEFFKIPFRKPKPSIKEGIKEAEILRKRIAGYLAEIDRVPEIVMPFDESKLSNKEIEKLRKQVSKYAVELKQAIPPSGLKGSDLQEPHYSDENADQIKNVPLL